jgi:glycosyltransferase involved in cell wall biosynthesis
MKVLMNTMPTSFQVLGGGGIVALKTKEYLEKEGIKVKLFNYWEDKIKDYDIFHNIGTGSSCFDAIESAHSQKVPVALTTIYDLHQVSYILKSKSPLKTKISQIGYNMINKHFQSFSKVKKMLDMSDILFPDTWMEGDLLAKQFRISKEKIFPVPHGVDERFMYATPDEFEEKYKLKDFVLFVGRIDMRKNVLSLIKAMKGTNIPLVIIGNCEPHLQAYFDECKKEADENVHFLGSFNHESTLLESAYSAAKVLVSPAEYETPGLIALEAGLAGTNVVITERGSTKDYYKEHASYVNPESIEDIKEKILNSYNSQKNNNLRDHIKENYLWDKIAKKTIEGYEKALEK